MNNLTIIIGIALTSLIVASPFFLQISEEKISPREAYTDGVVMGKIHKINQPNVYDDTCSYTGSELIDDILCSAFKDGYREGWETALE